MSNKEFICEYCNNKYKNLSNLTRHQKTARFCLKKQNKELTIIYKCEYCDYYSGQKSVKETHTLTCKAKKKFEAERQKNLELEIVVKDKEIAVKDKEIEMLKMEKEDLLKHKSKVINNNNITYNVQMNYANENLSPYEDFLESVKLKIWSSIKPCHITKGIDGYIALLNKLLPPDDDIRYYLSFQSKKDLFYRKKRSKIEYDDKANKLLKDIHSLIIEAVNDVYDFHFSGNDDAPKLAPIKRIGEQGTTERKKVVKAIADSFYISNNIIKSTEQVITEETKHDF